MARAQPARSRPAPRSAPRPRPRVLAGRGRGIRWDRVGRVALLVVLLGVVVLYVGPATSYLETRREAADRRADVRELQQENRALRARRAALKDPQTLEREARRIGLVRPGERAYIVKGLPGDADAAGAGGG